MKQFLLSALCAVAALPLLALPAQAQSLSPTGSATPTPGLGSSSGGFGGHRRGAAVSPEKRAQEIIAKYDKDGDHALNATELAAFFADRERMLQQRTQKTSGTTSASSASTGQPKQGNPQERAAKVIEKFDKNGDGKLDVSELTAALIAQHERAMQRRGQSSAQAQGQSQTPSPSPSHSAPATTILPPTGS